MFSANIEATNENLNSTRHVISDPTLMLGIIQNFIVDH